jgi:hypothetical protein
MKRLLFLPAVVLACAPAAFSHQPRLVRDQPSIMVHNPEISQAFYAWLNGSAQTYYIRSDTPFHLYLNLLVPDLSGIDTDYAVVIYKEAESPENIIARLEGRGFAWKPFFEPFGGDRYRLGPELERDVAEGTYIVAVSNPRLRGKYALAVGKKEKFPPGEWMRTIAILPKLKKEFFGKSPLTAYFNLTGLFIAFGLAGVIGLKMLIL